jgi:hypothetical protein
MAELHYEEIANVYGPNGCLVADCPLDYTNIENIRRLANCILQEKSPGTQLEFVLGGVPGGIEGTKYGLAMKPVLGSDYKNILCMNLLQIVHCVIPFQERVIGQTVYLSRGEDCDDGSRAYHARFVCSVN